MKTKKIILASFLIFALTLTAVNGSQVFGNENDITKENDIEQVETDSNKEKTTDVDKGKKSTSKTKASVSNTPRSNGIAVTTTVPTTFQTYTDPVTGLSPSELNVALALSINQADIEGAYIELPYDGFMPSLGDSVYANFDMIDDIFFLVTPSAPGPDSIIESFENDTVNNKLIIKLKKTVTTVETLNLKFKYNMDYDAKIPSEQIIWKDVQAIVKADDNSIISTSNISTVKAQTFSGDLITSFNFESSIVSSDVISGNLYFNNQSRKKSLLDENYDNYYYIDVPIGFDFNPKRLFGDSTKVEIENLTDYTRYIVKFEDSSTYFPSVWTDANGGYLGWSTTFSGFDNLSDDESIDYKIGIVYKKINDVVKTNESVKTFTKNSSLNQWDLATSQRHSPSGGSGGSIIDVSTPNSLGATILVAGGSAYSNGNTFKNLGSRDVKDIKLTLYQKNTGSEKISFSKITIYGLRESSAIPFTQYKVKYEIKNAITFAAREEVTALYSGRQEVTLPALSSDEYIDKVIVIPMGVSGTDEGHLSSKNGLTMAYIAKNWDTLYWPDGTAIPQNKTMKVPMGLTINYLDESDNTNPIAAEVIGNDYTHFYTAPSAIDSYARMVSSNATSKVPGDTINYELQGYVGKDSIASKWKAPEMVVAIPNVLELKSTTLKADYIDSVNNQTYTNAVNIVLLNSDTTYNYYRFTTSKDAYKIDSAISFKIPLEFKVADGTKQGTYNIPTVTVSGDDFVQVSRVTNNLGDASKYGYDNATSVYSAISGHTATTVASLTKLNGGTASRANSTDNWTNAIYFGVEKNTNPQMKSEIKNVGNTVFNNARLYNILPYDGDARGSSGNVEFTGLNGAGTVYYTTKPVAALPSYDGLDLQTWTTSTLTDNGFITTPPTDLSTVTAIYIDYGNLEINPLDNLETVMNFKIPNADNQIAVNQFVYSAKEKGTTIKLNVKSDAITFSTEIGQVIFNANTPTTTSGTVANMPDPISQTTTLDTEKKGSITLSSNIPILTGYTFTNWKDEVNNKTYNPNDTIYFDKNINDNTTLNLKAGWTVNIYEVAFDKNTGTGVMDNQNITYDTSAILDKNIYTKTGYTFTGWNTKADGTGTNYADEASVKNLVDNGIFTLYAKWEANTYTVTFDNNSGAGSMNNQSFTYDAEKALATNSFTKTGYTFDGWNTKADGTGASYANNAIVKNLVETGALTLYAKWNANTYTVTFDKNTGTGSMNNQSFTYDIEKALTTNSFTKTGYTFSGWNTKADGTGTNYADESSVKNLVETGTLILYAKWNANTYNVNYDLAGGTNHVDNPATYTYGVGVELKAPSKKGHTFLGWQDTLENSVTKISNIDLGDKTLIATWKVSTYSINYELDGGVNHPDNPASYVYGIGTELKEPTKTGYIFLGWIMNSNDATSITNISITDTGDKTLTATWKSEGTKSSEKPSKENSNNNNGSTNKETDDKNPQKISQTGNNNIYSSIMMLVMGLLISGGYLITRKEKHQNNL